jgi:hypothetical protein
LQKEIYFSYLYFFSAGVVLVISIWQAVINDDYSLITDVKTINNVFLAILLVSLDYNLELTKLLDLMFQKFWTSKKKDFLKDVSTEVITEVDSILRNYAAPSSQNQRSSIVLVDRMNYKQFKKFMLEEYFKIYPHEALGLNRTEKVKIIRMTFKKRATYEQLLTM